MSHFTRPLPLLVSVALLTLTSCGGGGGSSSSPSTPPAQSFSYDAVGRLTSATYLDGQSVRYEYDGAGNLIQKTVTTN